MSDDPKDFEFEKPLHRRSFSKLPGCLQILLILAGLALLLFGLCVAMVGGSNGFR
jgi:hypothetical protein